jgi:hypothetical protein
MVAYVPSVEETDLKKVILSLQQIAAGRSNAVGTVTLAVSPATTTVVIPTQSGMIASGSKVLLTPTTASAATELGAGTLYVSAVGKDTFTITHSSNAAVDRTFHYAIQG